MRSSVFIALAAPVALATAACGFRADDPELEDALAWARDFKADEPVLSRALAQRCNEAADRSAYTRDGALALFQCVRAKYEAGERA